MLLFLSGCISYTSITPLGSGRLQNALLDFDGGLAFVFVGHPRIPSGSICSSPAVLEFVSISTCPRRSCTVMTLNTSQRNPGVCLDPKSKSCQGINVLLPCSSHPTNQPPPKWSLFFPLCICIASSWVSAIPWELYCEGDSPQQSLNYFTCTAILRLCFSTRQ
jgi:hypothetical protein